MEYHIIEAMETHLYTKLSSWVCRRFTACKRNLRARHCNLGHLMNSYIFDLMMEIVLSETCRFK
jgi:hypothetical protein